jgi:hypothetical protein
MKNPESNRIIVSLWPNEKLHLRCPAPMAHVTLPAIKNSIKLKRTSMFLNKPMTQKLSDLNNQLSV